MPAALAALEGRPLTRFFPPSPRLTQSYVTIFIPALPVSFWGRGSPLEVPGNRQLSCWAQPWEPHVVPAPPRDRSVNSAQKDTNTHP